MNIAERTQKNRKPPQNGIIVSNDKPNNTSTLEVSCDQYYISFSTRRTGFPDSCRPLLSSPETVQFPSKMQFLQGSRCLQHNGLQRTVFIGFSRQELVSLFEQSERDPALSQEYRLSFPQQPSIQLGTPAQALHDETGTGSRSSDCR